jgi:hypothetical protein
MRTRFSPSPLTERFTVLQECFCAACLNESGDDATEPEFVTIGDIEGSDPLLGRCQEALASLSSDGYLSIAVELRNRGRLGRIIELLGLRARMARATESLTACGAVVVGLFGVTPDLGSPTVIYRLSSPAARYAEQHLLAGSQSLTVALVQKVLSLWTGRDSTLGAVLVIGRKP